MSNFLFWMGNHSELGQRSLEDVIGIIGHQMRALGHQAVWDPKNHQFLAPESGINVIVEGFTQSAIELIKNCYDQGARFLFLATEEPTAAGFNHGTQREMRWRQETFPLAAKYCEGIIHLVPGDHVTRWYSQFAPSAPCELGFAPSLLRATNMDPTYDFGFYGSATGRRLSILRHISKMIGTPKAIRVVADFVSQEERDKQMREAKVILQLRKFEKMGLVSSSRCNTALCIGRPIVAEPHDLSKPWDEIVNFTSSMDAFYATALVARSAWRGLWATQLAKFKEKLPPEKTIGAALQRINFDFEHRPQKRVAA
jgi:hypothetical protein